MKYFVAGVNYRAVCVGVLEKFSVKGERLEDLNALLDETDPPVESVVLSTCNRTEVYGITADAEKTREGMMSVFSRYSGLPAGELKDLVYFKTQEEAVRHAFHVASGLDSLALGETEILGQVKTAYARAHAAKRTGGRLNRLFQKALFVGKKVRAETDIGQGKVSVASIAVDLARKIFLDLSVKKILLLGSGEIACLVAEALQSRGAGQVSVSNRSLHKAEELVRGFGGKLVPYEEVDRHMGSVDILITSVGSPSAVVTRERVEFWMKDKGSGTLFIIDLGVPRNVEERCGAAEGVYLYNLDDLKGIAREALGGRQNAVEDCERIIHDAVLRFMRRPPMLAARGVLPA